MPLRMSEKAIENILLRISKLHVKFKYIYVYIYILYICMYLCAYTHLYYIYTYVHNKFISSLSEL